MKHRFLPVIIGVPAACLILVMLFLTHSGGKPDYLRYIPHDAAGVLIIENLPGSIENLQSTRLGEWIDFGESDNSASPRKDQLLRAASIYRENARHMLVCLHSIHQKENRSLRPELSLYLRPRTGRIESLAEEISRFVVSRFGIDKAEIKREGKKTIIRGPEKGQVFYLENCGSFLAASNSDEAWTRFQEIRNLDKKTVLMPSWYALMTEDNSADILIYFRGISGWIPGFVYSITETEDGLADAYREF